MFLRNFIRLRAAVHELSWSQRKNSNEHNTVRRYRADSNKYSSSSSTNVQYCSVACTMSCTVQLCGVALLGAGITMQFRPTIISYLNVVDISSSDPVVWYASVVFIVIGSVAFVVGFFGCCGSLKEQPACLLTVSELTPALFSFFLS